ncbi:MAG: hypothetical protein J4F35_08180 [Candidatus Latescibacteria bacterium]|nr:hypothetical protein [Candidatus Latescibacterota bacterium]
MAIIVSLAGLLVENLYADTAIDSLSLAHKFSPILVLTKDESGEYGTIRVTKPEPVEIMGAQSADPLQFYVGTLSKKFRDLDWSSLNDSNWNPLPYPNVDFSRSHFAFLWGGQYFGSPFLDGQLQSAGYYFILPYFDYLGTTSDVWNSVYFGEGDYADINNKYKGQDQGDCIIS